MKTANSDHKNRVKNPQKRRQILNAREINEIAPLEEDHESVLKILTEAVECGKSTHKSGDMSELKEPPW